MPRRIITEEELREAAREVLEYELAIFDSYNDYPDHIFHGKFRLDMAALIHEVKCGAVKAAKYSMGFTFYAKQCIAAVLLIFTLSCIAMPETVLAGYHKLIEVIETVFEDYTEYRYRINDDGGIEETFKPLKLGYLPEGMEEVKITVHENYVRYLFDSKVKDKKLNIYQKLIKANTFATHRVDEEKALIEMIRIHEETVKMIYKDGRITFSWFHDRYVIGGQTNLEKKELILILNDISF